MTIATGFLRETAGSPTEVLREGDEKSRFWGGGSFPTKTEFTRLWYHYSPGGLVIASFSTGGQRDPSRDLGPVLRMCERMVQSFDLQ